MLKCGDLKKSEKKVNDFEFIYSVIQCIEIKRCGMIANDTTGYFHKRLDYREINNYRN